MISKGKIIESNVVFFDSKCKSVEEELILVIKSKYYLLFSGLFGENNSRNEEKI
jgi:hypothetical protein